MKKARVSRASVKSKSAAKKPAVVPIEEVPKISDQESISTPFPIVAIGASAGGLEAITQLVEHLMPDLGMAYVVVQHLDPKHKSILVEILSRHTTLPVEEAKHKTKVEKNHIYVIPPNRNLFLERSELCLSLRSTSPAREMPIDYLFRTVALDCPGNCIGVVLSGTGSDGSLGIEEIKSAGGITFAQDQNSASHDGMPRAAIATGCIDFVLPPEAIAQEIKRIAQHPYTNGRHMADLSQEALLPRIFTMLRNRTSVDFKHYKQNTVKRRIFRRMALMKIETVDEYIRMLANNQPELDILYQDLLIKVTCFFREPNSFKVLHEDVFPALMRGKSRQDPIRIWVPGCSTGEEVYSVAIALLEYLGDNANSTSIQIFGTDVSHPALEKARSGIYIENIALDVSPERLRRWFVRVDRGYQISKDIREMCIFAKQNVTSDPPFSKIDLISCRNLLIYLDLVFQGRVMPIFHYALKPNGFLMLGNSESVGANLDLFKPVDKRAKIYTKKLHSPAPGVFFARTQEDYFRKEQTPVAESRPTPDLQQEADRFIVSRFAPAGVIIDEEFKVIQFRGSTGDYLEPSPGRATFNLLKMARGNLGFELRSLIQKARSGNRSIRKEGVRFQPRQGVEQEITLEVAPIRSESSSGHHFLVLFFEGKSTTSSVTEPPVATVSEKQEDSPTEITELKRELTTTKAYLQSTVEETDAANEELKSANEEIMSSNEELQSTNEELETAKEELQSTNEELTTVNEEVQARNAELSVLNGDLSNFLGSVNVPVVMLGTDLKIRRFTSMTKRVFNLIPTDIGRPFGDIRPKVNVPHLERLIAQVIDTITVHEQEVMDQEGRYYQMSIRPYRSPENKIDGAVLVFVDIDSVKRASLQLEEAKTYAESIVEAVLDPLLVLNSEFIIERANSAYYQLFKTDSSQTENRSLFALDKSQWDLPEVRQLLQAAFKNRKKLTPIRITADFPRIGERWLIMNARLMVHKSGKPPFVLLTLSDVTARKKAEEEKALLDRQLAKERSLFEAILRQMVAGVAIFAAPDGKLILANANLESILKRKLPPATDMMSFRKICASHITYGVYQGVEWPMERSLRKEEVVPYAEIILERPGAERMVLQVSSCPVYDVQKKMIAVVAIFLDITERKRIKEQIVDISSREQQRIAHDIHDGLGQELAAIGYRAKALKSRLGKTHSKEADEAGKIGVLAEAALARARDLVKFLQPVAMDERGLMQSLKDLAQSSSRLYHVNCVFICPRPIAITHPDVALHVFRIAQESVHNAIKHGKPNRIVIGLHKRRKHVELSISNNGTNFNPPKSARKRGLGLHIMSYRASVLHGELTIMRHHPKGTMVKCSFKPNITI